MAERYSRRDEENRQAGQHDRDRNDEGQRFPRDVWGTTAGERGRAGDTGGDWHNQGDGRYTGAVSRPESDDRDRRPGASDAHSGQHSGSQYGGTSSYGRGYPESDVMPRRGDWSPQPSDQENRVRAGQSGEWRGSGSSGRDDRSRGEPSWGGAGSYGRSQGAGSWGGGSRPDWQTGGGQGNTTVPSRESYQGRGPKGYTRSDERIREDVSERLADDPTVDASDITVSVQSGEVTLTGTVNSRDQKRRAEDCVEAVSGVRDVTNNLRMRRGTETESGTLSAPEQSSSLLGLGGQPSKETDDDTPVTELQPKSTGKRSGSTSGSAGGVS